MSPLVYQVVNGLLGGGLLGVISCLLHLKFLKLAPILTTAVTLIIGIIIYQVFSNYDDRYFAYYSIAWAVSVLVTRRIGFRILRIKDPIVP